MESGLNWEVIGAVGEIVGALGVLASLLYFAKQLKKNAEDTRNSVVFSVMSMQAEGRAAAMSSDIPEIIGKFQNGQALTVTEEQTLRYYRQTVMQGFEAAYIQYFSGTLDKDVMDAIGVRLAAFIIPWEGFSESWPRNRAFYSKRFAEYVDSVIAEHLTHSTDTQ